MIECFVCGGNADVLGAVTLNVDGDIVCGPACAEKYEANKKRFFASVGNDKAYAAWWASGGVDVKAFGDEAWKQEQPGATRTRT